MNNCGTILPANSKYQVRLGWPSHIVNKLKCIGSVKRRRMFRNVVCRIEHQTKYAEHHHIRPSAFARRVSRKIGIPQSWKSLDYEIKSLPTTSRLFMR
ncbi:hypothetical protein AVEN_98232-1 [Araneus ventricosus]|uniref:Uncharacterized protein n=1 Tax=Araneus ventricosus TaxID=182803 RepID=A0A4Y2AU83_ARAVE|nr:hypothetical protein AVEN_98232-1 [Araneus ventricosus]